MDLDVCLKAMLALMMTQRDLNYIIITKNFNQTRIIHDKFLNLFNEIPDWLRPGILENILRQITLGNGSRISFSIHSRYLQGQSPDTVGIVVSDVSEQIPIDIFDYIPVNKVYKVILTQQS